MIVGTIKATNMAPGRWARKASTQGVGVTRRARNKPPARIRKTATAMPRIAIRVGACSDSSDAMAGSPPRVAPGPDQAAGQPADQQVPGAGQIIGTEECRDAGD